MLEYLLLVSFMIGVVVLVSWAVRQPGLETQHENDKKQLRNIMAENHGAFVDAMEKNMTSCLKDHPLGDRCDPERLAYHMAKEAANMTDIALFLEKSGNQTFLSIRGTVEKYRPLTMWDVLNVAEVLPVLEKNMNIAVKDPLMATLIVSLITGALVIQMLAHSEFGYKYLIGFGLKRIIIILMLSAAICYGLSALSVTGCLPLWSSVCPLPGQEGVSWLFLTGLGVTALISMLASFFDIDVISKGVAFGAVTILGLIITYAKLLPPQYQPLVEFFSRLVQFLQQTVVHPENALMAPGDENRIRVHVEPVT
jgi:hypothetical protein